jgi:hypothetical protein
MTDKLKHLFNFDDLEIKKIENTTIKDRWHPVKRLLHPRAKFVRDDLVIYNTEIALRHILEHHENWLMSLKRRLLDVDDYSTSSGALGEIRAFGYLLWTGVSVNPVGNQGPYFLEHRTVPLGRPKIGETITENAINKLASIKGKEHQMSPDETSILWLDFQDEIWDGLDTRDRVLPLRTTTPNNAFQSGELWYAFYGWKDAPIYEEFRLDMLFGDVVKMRHDGRFRQDTKLDAVIISFSGDTIILENPYSKKPIKPWLWKRLVLLHRFNFEMSYTNWPAVNLIQRIELEEEKLKKLIDL